MRVVIRADASFRTGSGHVMRCLALAEWLREAGCEVRFVGRPGGLGAHIAGRGFPVSVLDGPPAATQEEDARRTAERLGGEPADWLVVDHYGLDARWERLMASHAARILAIDDLADRPHHCHLLLDPFDTGDGDSRYRGLVPAECRLLLGLRYLLLDPSFPRARPSVSVRSGFVRRVLVFYGGSDPTGETEKALIALRAASRPLNVDVVIGRANPREERIWRLCAKSGFKLHVQTPDMAGLMARADLAFGAGGVSLWERCYLGLPSIVTTVAANQRLSVARADGFGAVWSLGWHGETTPDLYRRALGEALQHPALIAGLSRRSLELTASVWGGGGIHPVAEAMLRLR